MREARLPDQAVWCGRGLRLAAGLVLALLALLVLAPVPAGADSPVDLAGYRQIIQTSLDRLHADPGNAAVVAQDLRSVSVVRLPNGVTVEPDLRAIVDDLNATHPNVVSAETSLSAILLQLDRSQSSSLNSGDVSAANASLRSILARREFQPAVQTPVQRVTGWVNKQLELLLVRLVYPVMRLLIEVISSAPLVLTIPTAIVGAVIVLVAIIGPLRSIRRGFGPTTARMSIPFSSRRVSAGELRQEAERLARERSYRLAIRTLYLAALVSLDERGLFTFERSLTNREVLRSAVARGDGSLADRLAPLVERFDLSWYGERHCTEADYLEFARLADWAWEAT